METLHSNQSLCNNFRLVKAHTLRNTEETSIPNLRKQLWVEIVCGDGQLETIGNNLKFEICQSNYVLAG